jgi:hypothetical protein
MAKRRLIAGKNLPIRPPFLGSMVYLLVLDRLGASSWVWGVVITLLVLAWALYIEQVINSEAVDLLDDDAPIKK